MRFRTLVCLALIHTLVDGIAQVITPLWAMVPFAVGAGLASYLLPRVSVPPAGQVLMAAPPVSIVVPQPQAPSSV